MFLIIIRRKKLRTFLVLLSISVLYILFVLEQNKTRTNDDENSSEKTAILIPINIVNLSTANYDRNNSVEVFFAFDEVPLTFVHSLNYELYGMQIASLFLIFMLVDIDCMQKMNSNLRCNLPISIAVFQTNDGVSKREDVADEFRHLPSWLNIKFIVKNATDKDYWLFTGNKHKDNAHNGNVKRHAVKRYKTVRTVLPFGDGHNSPIIYRPSEVSNFIRNWQNGLFLDCEHALTRPAEGKRLIPLSFAKRIAEFMEFVEKYNATPFLLCGTLLGWRRECSIIPHTTDVDIGILREQHSLELLRALIASPTFSVSKLNGYMNSTFMMALWVDGIKIDFDFVFTNADGKAYVAGFRGNRQILRWIYPRIQQICAGDLLGHLVHVPCNVDEILKADYGPNWRIDHPTSNFIWDRSHKNRESGEILPQEEWDRIIIETTGQNKTNATVVDAWLKRVGQFE